MGLNTLWPFVVFIFGMVLIGVLLYKHKYPSTRWLAFFLFTLAYGCFLYFLFESRYLLEMPFFYRTGWLFLYMAPAALLFYFRYLVNENRKMKWYDALHFLPALIYLIDFLPFFLSSNDHKREVLRLLFEHRSEAVYFREGWLIPDGLHYYLRHIIGVGYAFNIGVMLFNRNQPETKNLMKNVKMRQWMILILAHFFLFSLFGLITYLFSDTRFSIVTNLWASVIMFAGLSIALLFRPEVLYGMKTGNQNKKETKSKPVTNSNQFPSGMPASLMNFLENRLYLNRNIKIQTVAEELGVQPHVLSAYINQVYGMRFNDLVNWCRIQYIKDGLNTTKWNLLTLEGISEEAGFNNRTTFLAAFKKFTGVTPTAFVNGARDEMTEKKFLSTARALPINLGLSSGSGEKGGH